MCRFDSRESNACNIIKLFYFKYLVENLNVDVILIFTPLGFC